MVILVEGGPSVFFAFFNFFVFFYHNFIKNYLKHKSKCKFATKINKYVMVNK
jgi:hypothetical protein